MIPRTRNLQAQRAAILRFLEEEGIRRPLPELWPRPEEQVPSCLCYLERDGRLLLLRRKRPPFVGLLTAPGGKLEPGESPAEAAVREVREETGLRIERPQLVAITTESGPPHYNWLLFMFHAEAPKGEPGGTEEGELGWISFERAAAPEGMHEADRLLWPHIFGRNGPTHAILRYRDDESVLDVRTFPLR